MAFTQDFNHRWDGGDDDDSNYYWRESDLYAFAEFLSLNEDADGAPIEEMGIRLIAIDEEYAAILRSKHSIDRSALACQIILLRDLPARMRIIKSMGGLPDISSAAYELWRHIFMKQDLLYNDDPRSLGAEGP